MKASLVCLLTVVTFICGGAMGQTRPAEDRSLPQQVQKILGVKGKGELLPALADLLEQMPLDTQRAGAAMDRFVRVLDEGVVPDTLTALLIDRTTLTDPFTFQRAPGWKYGGDYMVRSKLAHLLWAKSLTFREAGKNQAARDYARAAMLFAAEQEFWLTSAVLSPMLRDPKRLRDVAELDDGQIEALEQLDADMRRQSNVFYSGPWESFYSIREGLASTSGPLPPEKVEEALRWLMKGRDATGKSVTLQYTLLTEACSLLSLAQSRGTPQQVQAITKFLNDWRSETQGPIKRWLDEAVGAKS